VNAVKGALAILSFLSIAVLSNGSRAEDVTPSPAARPIGGVDLTNLYRNKTWLWPNGAAHFGGNGHFEAWSRDSDGKKITATGNWGVLPDGRMCFGATWIMDSVSSFKETCFAHVADGGVIFQKREPQGEWSIFRHAKVKSGDEIGKLLAGDRLREYDRDYFDGQSLAGWRPAQLEALAKIYAGRTWIWRDGGAYFAADGNFTALSGGMGRSTIARGTWQVRPEGKLCFTANWGPKPDDAPKETCFSHLAKGGTILQLKEPDGRWFVFKHAQPRDDDEVHKLVLGDQLLQHRVAAHSKKLLHRIAAHSKRNQHLAAPRRPVFKQVS
jgi:hypothetical protein